MSVDDSGGTNAQVGKCKSIQTLDIFGTKVSKKGIQLVLENLLDLKVFDCSYQIQDLAELLRGPLHKMTNPQPETKRLQLTSLHNFGKNHLEILCRKGDIELVATTFPSVSKINIYAKFLDSIAVKNEDKSLLELLKLKNLCELRMQGGKLCDRKITFHVHCLPILRQFSDSLTSLTIDNFYHLYHPKFQINTPAIVKSCPNLQSLELNDVTISSGAQSQAESNSSTGVMTKPVLKNLKTLSLSQCRQITSEDLDLLLASPGLRELSLSQIALPIDGSLVKAANLHHFSNLERLWLKSLSGITKAGIDLLMNDGNCLQMIHLKGCEKLNLGDYEEWRKLARKFKWEVDLQFY